MRDKPRNFRKDQALRLLEKEGGAAGFSSQSVSSTGAQGQIGAIEVNREHLAECKALWDKDKIKKASDPIAMARHVASSPYRGTHKLVEQMEYEKRPEYKGSKANPKAGKPHREWAMKQAQKGHKVHTTEAGNKYYLSSWKPDAVTKSEELAKEGYGQTPEQWKTVKGAHGWISPEGKFHQMEGKEEIHGHVISTRHGLSSEGAYNRGWLAIGHGGHSSVSGHHDVLTNPEHKATKTARKLINEYHGDDESVQLITHTNAKQLHTGNQKVTIVPAAHWHKHGTIPKSKTALFRSEEPLSKISHMGWISPKGKFHELDEELHEGFSERISGKKGVTHMYDDGWLSVGHEGGSNIAGHAKVLDNPNHPATKTSRKLAQQSTQEHMEIERLDDRYHGGTFHTVPTKHWIKHGTIPKSKVALFRSIGEKLQILRKELRYLRPEEVEEMKPFHGVISSKGEFHQMRPSTLHTEKLLDHASQHKEKHGVGMAEAFHHVESNSIQTGLAGRHSVAAHSKVIHDPSHPATKQLAKLVRERPAHVDKINVSLVDSASNYDVPRHMAERGNFRRPSKMQMFKGEALRKIYMHPKAGNAHGWISPEGKYHKMGVNEAHEDWIDKKIESKGKKDLTSKIHDAYKDGWLSVGHGGGANVQGHSEVLGARSHPATVTARKVVQEQTHASISDIHLNFADKNEYKANIGTAYSPSHTVNRDHWAKHGTVPKSKTALFRSIGEKLQMLRKEMWARNEKEKKEMRPFHGLISHKGEFHQIQDSDVHMNELMHHARQASGGSEKRANEYYVGAHKKGWIQTGITGKPTVEAHSEVIHDPSHKSTKALASKVKELPEHVEHVEVHLLDRPKTIGYEIYKVPRHLAERGNFRPPSKVQEFHKAENEHIDLIHYSPNKLSEIHPKYHGKGVKGADREYKGEADYHPRSYFYIKGTKPEHLVAGSTKYKHHVKVPSEHVYNAGKDKHNFSGQVKEKNQGAFRMTAFEDKVKRAGYKGYKVGDVVAMFEPTKPHAVEEHKDRPLKKAGPKGLLPHKYSIITAENPANKPSDKGGNKALESKLKAKGYKYEPVQGKYSDSGKVERGFLVHDANPAHINRLGAEHGQESVIHSEGGKHKMQYTSGDKAGQYHVGEGHTVHEKEPKNFYSTIQRGDQKHHFTLNFDFDKLHKAIWGRPTKKKMAFHGVISPKGEYHKMDPHEDHFMALTEGAKTQTMGEAFKQGWLSVGSVGRTGIEGHEKYLKDKNHPATKTARKLAFEVHPDEDIELMHHTDETLEDKSLKPAKIHGISTTHWHKHGTIPKSKVAQFHKSVQRESLFTNREQNEGMNKNDPVQAVFDLEGISVQIEWPKGSVRAYADGYEKKMEADYGFIEDVIGDDGEELDVYVGGRPDSKRVFIITQLKKKTGKYDEKKVMLHYATPEEATQCYKYHMPDRPVGGIEEISWEQLTDMVQRKEKDRLQGEEKPDGTRHIVKKSQSDPAHGWISPEGKMHVIHDHEEHENWIENH